MYLICHWTAFNHHQLGTVMSCHHTLVSPIRISINWITNKRKNILSRKQYKYYQKSKVKRDNNRSKYDNCQSSLRKITNTLAKLELQSKLEWLANMNFHLKWYLMLQKSANILLMPNISYTIYKSNQ